MPARSWPLTTLMALALGFTACAAPGSSSTPSTQVAPTTAPTSTPTSTAESDLPSPSAEASIAPSESSPPSGDELDITLASNFGSTDLTAGFAPDPYSVALVSGGAIDASYLGDGCRGFATAASDYDVAYEAGGSSLLRFYFVADEADDTTLIINAPDGSWHCNDDAPDTIDPMVDFDNPADGRYDIWVGSYDVGTTNSGTLYVTELGSNAP